jgi:hypothetical protein
MTMTPRSDGRAGHFEKGSPLLRWDLGILACDWFKLGKVPSQTWTPFLHPLVEKCPIVAQTKISSKV